MRSPRKARPVICFVLLLACFAPRLAAGPEDGRGPSVPADPAPRSCEAPADPIQGQVSLDRACVYAANLIIEHSHTTLDCDGARISPEGGRAILIQGQLEDVTVRNCYLGGGGLRVEGPDREPGETDDALRARSPSDIVIEHIHITESHMSGIFVGDHVVGVTIRDSIIENTGSSGIYLEYGSQATRIENNLIRDDGFWLRSEIPRQNWWRREGIAVDASAHNVIVGNDLTGNAFGGIFLYKNCWEYAAYEPDSEQRHQHAHSNLIEGNRFWEMPIGVWVAARQARDLGAWNCGDETPYDNPIPLTEAFGPDYPVHRGTFPAPYDVSAEYLFSELDGRACPDDDCSTTRDAVHIWPDFAENNTVRDNRFEDLSLIGVRVEDDDTSVEGNLFFGDFDYVYLGTPFRARYLGQPVRRTRIANNLFSSETIGAFGDNLALIDGEHADTTLADNGPACRLAGGGWGPCPDAGDEGDGCDHAGRSRTVAWPLLLLLGAWLIRRCQ